MLTVTRVIATTNEVSLKGQNRKWFERKITENTRRALADLPLESVRRPAWRVLATFSEPVPFTEVARRLSTVFGLAGFVPAVCVGQTTDDLEAALPELLCDASPTTFAVRCQRSDKRFPLTSVEVERKIGHAVQKIKPWPVDLDNPDLTLRILIDQEGIHVWTAQVAGPGGLPCGSGGRALCLLSGGIDSPVAAYMAMKRGLRLDFVHFHSVPRTDPASLEKVVDLARVLVRYQGACRIAMIPLLPIQERIVAECPARYRVLLYRRYMMRLSRQVATSRRCHALVTGESLGQVASQTIENLAAVESVAAMPVLRPLISFDKQQIVDVGRRAGTYEISIRPQVDCCSFLVPEHPATRAHAEDLDHAEMALDEATLIADALRDTETTIVEKPVPWSEIPTPWCDGGRTP